MKKLLWRKRDGKVELVTGLFFMVFLVIISAIQVQLGLFHITGLYMEDALAASNLASAIADIREYGMNHVVRIEHPDEAYRVYKEALRVNLQLDENWESSRKDLITGRVEVLQYIIYNVRGNDITVYCYGAEANSIYEEKGGLGSVRTPDGTLVESTTVYSRIGFPVEGILGIKVYAEKEKSVDIVS